MADHNVLFMRSQEEENNDPWDDTLLIKAYESAFEKVKADVNRKLKQPAPSTPSQQKPAQQGPGRKWKVGDFCRAVFSDDGLKYEGVLTNIDGNHCTIKYYGYDNEEDKPLHEIFLSKGKPARQRQIQRALQDNMDWEDNTSASQESSASSKRIPMKPELPEKSHNVCTEDLGFMFPPPPPPPLFDSADKPPSSREALHAMLMSWFMSGYHTGYYEGIKRADEQRK